MQRAADAPRLLEDGEVARIARALGRTPAQVLVRWAVQRGTSVLPKSTDAGRIAQNLDVLDWELPKDDFDALNQLPVRMRMVPGHFMVHPEGPYKTLEDLWDK
jgi:diketogulonate reductase-like aldo/keto reductase